MTLNGLVFRKLSERTSETLLTNDITFYRVPGGSEVEVNGRRLTNNVNAPTVKYKKRCRVGINNLFTITNYDTTRVYTVTTDNGTITKGAQDNEYIHVAATVGEHSIFVNGVELRVESFDGITIPTPDIDTIQSGLYDSIVYVRDENVFVCLTILNYPAQFEGMTISGVNVIVKDSEDNVFKTVFVPKASFETDSIIPVPVDGYGFFKLMLEVVDQEHSITTPMSNYVEVSTEF